MPTLGTQTISSSYAQLLKTFTTGGLDGTLQVITDGDNTSSALSLSTTGVKSTGSFAVDGAATFAGLVTVGSLEIGGSTGPTITKLSYGTASLGAATLGTMTTASSTSTGTFALAGIVAGDTVIGQTNIAFTGSYPMSSFSVFANDVCRYTLFNSTTTISTITSGTISAIALRTIS